MQTRLPEKDHNNDEVYIAKETMKLRNFHPFSSRE